MECSLVQHSLCSFKCSHQWICYSNALCYGLKYWRWRGYSITIHLIHGWNLWKPLVVNCNVQCFWLSQKYESAVKIFKIIDNAREGQHNSSIPDGSRDITLEEASGNIEFHGVWFKYPSTCDYVIKNFSFKINSQESVGFVGESGCGKSTVTLLLLRFYEPDKGFITIGGTKITEFSIKSLQSLFGLVQQEPIIFNCSVMENIWYGKPHATAQEIRMAAELANANTFISNLDVIENGQSSK